MRKILITGGTVFVSKYVAKYFVEMGEDVYVMNRNTKEQVRGVKLIECDRNNIGNRLKGLYFDAILDITAYTKEHVEKLLGALDKFGEYVLISSSAVYPETNIQPFKENQECGFNSIWGDYGTNKIEAEKYLLSKFPNAYILRPPYLYGEMQNLYREAFVFECADRNRKFYLPKDGEMKLQFFDIEDLCLFINTILEKHPKEHIFNVGNYESISIKNWVKMCYEVAGAGVPEFVSVYNVDDQRDYFCFKEYEYLLDTSLQRKYLTKTKPLSKGLKESYLWYKSNKDKVQHKEYFKFIDEIMER